MKTYILELYEAGGCDYLIGCGTVIVELQVETEDELNLKIEEQKEWYGKSRINKVTIYEVVNKKVLFNDVE